MPFTAFEILTVDDLSAEIAAAVGPAQFHPAALAHRTGAGFSVSSATVTAIGGLTSDFDNNGMVGINVMTVASAGLWLVTGMIEFASNATGWRRISARVNGTPGSLVGPVVPAVNGLVTRVPFARLANLAVSDTVQIEVEHNAGVALTPCLLNEFGMFRLSAPVA